MMDFAPNPCSQNVWMCSLSSKKKVNVSDIPLLCINGHNIERVNEFKLLGVIITADLSWDSRVAYMLQKVAKRMYCINYLARAGLPTSDILCLLFYNSFCS